ncbi:SIR2-domain-containing protein [Dacryopinax primogenitus]|uniref:SIR2-domain-containing protein n=1 Tax=Dacryopinax primogenitus (strain DJM 731) TaxID=1858805 RepID=M5GC32_DACPD|nr:SIR2-domain-containing protein [Dacryopinax primogenitus]EJU03647.1 SIR2-domain-containing protein [Dacryopinax primogenitus]
MASRAANGNMHTPVKPNVSIDDMPMSTDVGPGPQVKVSYQDSYSNELDDVAHSIDGSDHEYQQLMEEAMHAFTEEEVEQMMGFLKERGMMAFLQRYVGQLDIPPSKLLLAFGVLLAPDLRSQLTEEHYIALLKQAISRTLRDRERLSQYETIDDAVALIRNSKHILVLTGAGISVSCGIPDFRSTQGIYAQLRESEIGQTLADPQQMFDLKFFKENPSVFYSFAHRIFPSNFKPSPCHYFIKLLEDKSKLLRNYTQNIDTLETVAGVKKVLNCHGSFATASCITCGTQFPGEEIKEDIFAERIPKCTVCIGKGREAGKKKSKGKGKMKPWEEEVTDEDEYKSILKPDITFFGEKLTSRFDKALFEDREEVDLLLVIGTSLTVAPVSEILHHIPHSIPQIIINKTPVPHVNPDIVILGEADEAVRYLSYRLGWELPIPPSSEAAHKRPREDVPVPPERVGQTWIWTFGSADGGEWLEEVKEGKIRRYMLASSDDESGEDEGDEEVSGDYLRPPKGRDSEESDNSQASKRRRLQ